jgi:T-complex protein 1 subunit zeta
MLGNKGTRKFYRTGGTRGGQDQFKWEDVKSDKYRENYLGHSAMAPVGRWQSGKDIFWYAKKGEEEISARQQEIELLKRRDEEQISVALGLKRSSGCNVGIGGLAPEDLKALFSRGATERASTDIERIEGLGAAPTKTHEHIAKGPSALEREIESLRQSKLSGERRDDPGYQSESLKDDSRNASAKLRVARSSSSESSRSHRRSKHSKKSRKDRGRRHGEDRDRGVARGGAGWERNSSKRRRRSVSRSRSRDRRREKE